MASKMLSLLPLVSAKFMDCGSAPLCGVLVIESGLAPSGTYHQDLPGTHGLWPETGSYGTSQCIAPSGSTADPTKVYSCYENDGSGLVSFEAHEWQKHGQCAGVRDEADFFTQVCSMSTQPISIMTTSKKQGGDLNAMASALRSAGYPVFDLDTTNYQVYLAACAGYDGRWKLAETSQFSSVCGGSLI
jgi:hypothetical protein